MTDVRAVAYIKRMLDSGYSSQLIYSELLKEGYSENEIQSAFRAVYSEMEKAEAVQSQAPKTASAAKPSKIPLKILVPVLLGIIAIVMIIFVVPLSLFSTNPAPANTEFFAPESPQAQQEFQPPPAFEAPQQEPAPQPSPATARAASKCSAPSALPADFTPAPATQKKEEKIGNATFTLILANDITKDESFYVAELKSKGWKTFTKTEGEKAFAESKGFGYTGTHGWILALRNDEALLVKPPVGGFFADENSYIIYQKWPERIDNAYTVVSSYFRLGNRGMDISEITDFLEKIQISYQFEHVLDNPPAAASQIESYYTQNGWKKNQFSSYDEPSGDRVLEFEKGGLSASVRVAPTSRSPPTAEFTVIYTC